MGSQRSSGTLDDKQASTFVRIRAVDRDIHLEYAWIASGNPKAPLLVFLHEGLGSLAMWKDWPQRV